jgi:hypothetical protein
MTETTEGTERTQYCANLRALADFIELRTDLPVPQGVHVQYSVLDGAYADRLAEVRRVADALGVQPHMDGHAATYYLVGSRYTNRVEYCIHTAEPVAAPLPHRVPDFDLGPVDDAAEVTP